MLLICCHPGSGFSDRVHAWPLQWFAEHQPFTPIIETLRGLLLGTPIGDHGWIAVAWCLVLSLVGYLWAQRLYERVPTRAAT
jgi:ABC-2 type transport system permease protein